MNEIVEALLAFLEQDLKIPRDIFFQPEEGNENDSDGERSWTIKLKSNPEYFFWFRIYRKELLYNCNPRMKKYS